jgi:hypothetical protein
MRHGQTRLKPDSGFFLQGFPAASILSQAGSSAAIASGQALFSWFNR